jgi:putative Ca2+/H+ antiporter (TMEM165/GDT1 family)
LEWKSALITFAIIFFAELGDKTQLMVMSMSARSKTPQMVFLGAAAALITSSLVAVWVGDAFLRVVPLRLMRLGTGVAFIGIGTILLFRSIR